MSLQFIFGNSGSGKSHYLYQTVIKESMEHLDENYIVLVPEQFTMQTQKDMVLMHPNKGIMNIDVLSFGRLAYRVFEEVGEMGATVLDDEGKNLILRRIAGQYDEELHVLSGNLKRLGYISEVKSVISEFTQYDLPEEKVAELIDQVTPESMLQYKLRDIHTLYKGFRSFLSGRYITGEELLDVLASVVPEAKLLKNSTVVLDGFTGFTPVQERLLKELLKVCKKVMVTVTIDQREDPYVWKHPYQLFAMSKKTVTGLCDLAKEAAIDIEEPVQLYAHPVYRFRENEPMAFLEQELFRYSKRNYEKEQEQIQVHIAQNPNEEVKYIAQKIRNLVRTRGYRYRDFAVIVSDMDTYAEPMQKECEAYKLPIFMDYKRSILLNSFVEYMRSLIEVANQNLSYESVFRFLRSGLTDFSMEQIDQLENYVLAFGIQGKKKWEEPWIKRNKQLSVEALEELNTSREELVQMLSGFLEITRQSKKTVTDMTKGLYDFFVDQEIQDRLEKLGRRFEENQEPAMAKEYQQIYGIVLGLFDKFVELLGEERVTTEEYSELLDAGLAEARVGIIPPRLDSVVVGDVMRTRLKDVKVLFFVGVNDVWLPGNQNQGGLLSVYDREVLEQQKVRLQPGGKEQAYIQKFYLYLNLTKPKEELHLSYSKVSLEGKSIRPAYLINEVKKLYPELQIVDETGRPLTEIELTPEEGIPYLIQRLGQRNRPFEDSYKELFVWYQQNQDWARRVESYVAAGFYARPKDRLSVQVAKKLYGSILENSVTRLEQFSACAYAHFLTYGLQLKERETYGFEAVDMGNVFHSAIERYSKRVSESEEGWIHTAVEVKDRWIDECLQESISEYGNTVLYNTARDSYMVTRMKRQMKRTIWALTKQLEVGDFVPKGYEVAFGGGGRDSSVNISLSEEAGMRIRGKIDRLDEYVDEDKVYVKVMDYKTGHQTFDLVAMYYGLQLQLMVYMNAAVEIEKQRYPEKEVVPAGVFYYQIKDPLVDKPTNQEDVERLILEELRPDGLVYEDLQTMEHLTHEQEGKSMAIPVKFNKNGSLSKESKTALPEEFRMMGEYTTKVMGQIGHRILDGEIEARPYQQGDKNGCTYCRYKNICGFDRTIPGCHYRRLEKLSKEEVLDQIRKKV